MALKLRTLQGDWPTALDTAEVPQSTGQPLITPLSAEPCERRRLASMLTSANQTTEVNSSVLANYRADAMPFALVQHYGQRNARKLVMPSRRGTTPATGARPPQRGRRISFEADAPRAH